MYGCQDVSSAIVSRHHGKRVDPGKLGLELMEPGGTTLVIGLIHTAADRSISTV